MFNLLKLWKFFVPTLSIDMGGGGGGGGTPAQTTQTQELPEWAKPYAKDILAKGQALTDINQNPYQQYGQDRIAGFTPMQQQAQQGAANMAPAWQGGLASQYAAQAGMYQPGRFGTQDVRTGSFLQPGASDAYMSPYMQNVVDVQQREAQRQSDIQRNQNQAQAVGAGAFGGSRQAIVEAERQRNLGTQLGSIQAQGLQSAYQQGQQQFNTEQQARLQAALANQQTRMQAQQLGEQSRQYGAGLGLQAAGQLGTLGGQQLQQQMDINKLQSAYGGQQQALKQQGLDQAYQDFVAQQNYPYKQLGFMSDLLRGTPTGSSSVTQMYGAQPGLAQTLGGIGMGAYGLSKFMADGGVTSSDNETRIINKLSDAQIQKALQAAKVRNDQEEISLLSEEMAERASIRGGLGGAFNALPAGQQEAMTNMAGGGIVAFGEGGKTPRTAADYIAQAFSKDYTAPTEDEQEAGITKGVEFQKRMRGESVTAPYLEEIKKERADLAGQREQAKGLAALAAAQGLLSSPSLGVGVGKAFGAAGETLAKADKDQREANRALRESEMKLAMADQARNEGMLDKAQALYKDAEALKRESAEKTRTANLTAASTLGHMESAKYTADRGYAGHALSANKPTDLERIASSKLQKLLADNPEIKNDPKLLAAAQEQAYTEAANIWGKLPGTVRSETAEAGRVSDALKTDPQLKMLGAMRASYATREMTPELQKKVENIDAQIAKRTAEIRAQNATQPTGTPGQGTPSPSAAPQTVTIGNQTYVRPPGMTDQQWSAYQAYVKGNK